MPRAARPRFWAHPTAVIDPPATIGAGTKIWHFAHVMTGATIGADCVLGQNAFVAAGAAIGDRCRIQNNVSLYDGVVLGDDVFVGPSAVFTNVINPRAFIARKAEYRRTVVEAGATIGANATIICGHRLGAFCLIAAGAVVTTDVAPHALVAGVPARQIGWVCRCGTTLPRTRRQPTCPACHSRYSLSGRGAQQQLTALG